MIVTQAMAEELVRQEMHRAKKLRASVPYSVERFPMRLTTVLPSGATAKPEVPWESRDHMLEGLFRLARLFKLGNVQACVVTTDARYMNTSRVGEFLGIEVPDPKDPASIDRFKEEYGKHFRSDLMNREMRNLPRHLWDDALLVIVKGPNLKTWGMTARYVEGPRDSVSFQASSFAADEAASHQFLALEDWWKIPDDDPGYLEVCGWVEEEVRREGT